VKEQTPDHTVFAQVVPALRRHDVAPWILAASSTTPLVFITRCLSIAAFILTVGAVSDSLPSAFAVLRVSSLGWRRLVMWLPTVGANRPEEHCPCAAEATPYLFGAIRRGGIYNSGLAPNFADRTERL